MIIIKKYKFFLEARLSDVLNIKSDTNLSKKIQKLKDKEYDFSKKLLKSLYLDNKENGKKILFKILWNDTLLHNIQVKLKERTSFKSAEEFNSVLRIVINKIFPKMAEKDLNKTGRYAIYLKEYNITIIAGFKLSNKKLLTIYTILNGKHSSSKINDSNKKILKLIEIE